MNLLLKIKMLFMSENEVFYINGSDTLPPPLSKAEEAQIMQRISEGDEGAREPLIVHNLRLVVYIARKFETPSAGTEDLISIGTIGLIKAVNTFSPEKNIKLATYASRCIENEILMFLRKSSQLKNEVSIDEPLNTDWDGNELLLCDILGSDPSEINDNLENELERNLVLREVSKLNRRECKIMELRFGLNGKKEHTQKQVADRLGISQSYISRHRIKAMGYPTAFFLLVYVRRGYGSFGIGLGCSLFVADDSVVVAYLAVVLCFIHCAVCFRGCLRHSVAYVVNYSARAGNGVGGYLGSG